LPRSTNSLVAMIQFETLMMRRWKLSSLCANCGHQHISQSSGLPWEPSQI
jgi:hypothetical protein